VRLFATESPSYDPLSYNDGSVWPFVTGFTMMAEFLQHRWQGALQHLYGVAALTGFSGRGFIPEYMSGDRAQRLSRAVPHQLFSSTAVIHPLISGLLGLSADAVNGVLRVAPHSPPDWGEVSFSRYVAGTSNVSGNISRARGMLRVRITVEGKPLRLELAPALPPGTSGITSAINGHQAAVRADTSDVDVHALVSTGPVQQADVSFRFDEGVTLLPELVAAEPGDRSHAVRLLETRVEPDRVTFELAGPSGGSVEVRAWHGDRWQREQRGLVRFPPAESEFSRTAIVFRKR
jgi:hypothetical protein